MDPFDSVLKDLQTLYTQLSLKLTDPNSPDNPLSRKSISQLSNKLYPLMDSSQGPKNNSDQNKHVLLQVFSSHLTNYLNNNLIINLVRCHDDDAFIATVSQGWQQFKRFVFTYHALLIHAKEFFEKESVNAKQRENYTYPNVLPVPALALKLFSQLVLNRFTSRLERGTVLLLSRSRQHQYPESQNLRILISIFWSCSLGELGRISMSKQGNITFWKQKNRQITHIFKEANRNEQHFRGKILSLLQQNSAVYYKKLYGNNLRHLNAFELTQHLQKLCLREERIADLHMPSDSAVQHYLAVLRRTILEDIEGILHKQKGFKYIFLNCSDHYQELLPHAVLYFSLFQRLEDKSIPLVSKLMCEAILQKGQQIFSKQVKPRDQIINFLKFKKAVRNIFNNSSSHNLDIEQNMERQFRKLMEPIECSKNLAEYADHIVKECVRLKMDDDNCRNKCRDILFLLSSLSAKDSFLMHYQEHLSRRLLDSLHEPRTDIETIALEMIGEQLGNIIIAQHIAMVKDIQKSIQSSEQLHDRLPFISYKWDIRVFNPSIWPESASKLKYSSIQSPSLFQTHIPLLQELYQQHFGVHLKLRLDKGTSLFEGKFQAGKFRFQAQNSYLFLLLHLSDQPDSRASLAELRTFFVSKKEQKSVSLQHLILVLVECNLVKRKNKEEPLQEKEVLMVNQNYRPPQGSKPQLPIQIRPSPALIKHFKESTIDESKILKEREKLIDAMLVKLLKHAHSTKGNSISFQELYQGVCGNSFLKSLNLSQNIVKQRLQYLIVKQFCQRDEDDRRIYHYVA